MVRKNCERSVPREQGAQCAGSCADLRRDSFVRWRLGARCGCRLASLPQTLQASKSMLPTFRFSILRRHSTSITCVVFDSVRPGSPRKHSVHPLDSTLPRLRHISMTGTTITQLFQPPRPRRLFQPYRDDEQVARKLAFRAAAARTGTLALVNIRPADASFGLEYVPNLEKLEPSYLDIAEENSAVDPTDPLRGIVDQSATLMRLSLNLIDGRKPMLDWEGVVIPNLQYFALRISTLEDADWTFLAANASRLKALDLRSYRLWRCPCRPRSRARPSHPSSTSTSPPFRSCNRSCPPSSHPPFARSPASPNSLPVTWQPSPSPPPRTRRPTLPQHSSSNPHPRHHRPLAPSDSFSTRKRY